ncbi:hypothetical protein B0T19DRAFT_216859 [Cercophora scortea]|uniref:C2H2-type domain-containing protein n=1 Tax=Cercophora scortea TaxID=314031 RepID=A0AAE0M9I5_9PEZI|nr:hypothetical protein B0T19DRAFT_216859 [Cercophora scortea]
MDQQHPNVHGRSPSASSTGGGHGNPHQQPHVHIKNSHSPSLSPASYPDMNQDVTSSIGLGLSVVNSAAHQYPGNQVDYAYSPNTNSYLDNPQAQPYNQSELGDPSLTYDLNLSQGFTDQLKAEDPPFGGQNQGGYQQNLGSNFGVADFTIFPTTSGEQQYDTPLFDNQQLGSPDTNMMAPANHSPPSPNLFGSDPHQSSSANHSPSFNQQHFPSGPGRHSRNVSLAPEAALLPHQVDWSQSGPQFHTHRRSPSEFSDVSSAAPSPNLGSSDTFDHIDHNHSPMQRPQDAALFEQELHGINNFSISDHGTHSPHHGGRSPSLSPAISPRILPQQLPEANQHNSFLLQAQNNSYGPPASYMQPQQEAFPTLPQDGPDMQQQPQPQLAAPSINIEFAPTTAARGAFEQPKNLDADSLTPPERGRRIQRPRAVTDPYNSAGGLHSHRNPSASGSLSPQSADARSDSSRSLSPLDRSNGASSPSRRRQSTSSVPNNVIALRLADPEYTGPGGQGENGAGGPKRIQKHPATFQCTLCPKRFTRAYNLRSHLRTHTDERPFVCTVCGKAFARQHDRKRHEGLHSGEKKFVCKGDLKGGGQWGCGRRFARADALGRHFRSEAGRICIKPLLDEEMLERQRLWNEQRMQQAPQQGMVMQGPGMMMPPGMDPNTGAYPTDNYALPQALLAQYPALAQMNWSNDMGGGGSGMEDDLSGRSSFDASDYEEADDGGYVSGPGTGFGQGGMQENFGDMGYASDYGGR